MVVVVVVVVAAAAVVVVVLSLIILFPVFRQCLKMPVSFASVGRSYPFGHIVALVVSRLLTWSWMMGFAVQAVALASKAPQDLAERGSPFKGLCGFVLLSCFWLLIVRFLRGLRRACANALLVAMTLASALEVNLVLLGCIVPT